MPTADTVDSCGGSGVGVSGDNATTIKQRIERLNLAASDQDVQRGSNGAAVAVTRKHSSTTTQQVTTVTKLYSHVQHHLAPPLPPQEINGGLGWDSSQHVSNGGAAVYASSGDDYAYQPGVGDVSDSGGHHSTHLPRSGYDELDSTLVPGRGAVVLEESPYGSQRRATAGYLDDQAVGRPMSRLSRQSGGSAAPRAVFDEVIRDVVREQDLSPQQQQHDTLQFRDPDLHEVINFLSNANNVVKANAAAYLQHLCYMDDPMKQKTRALGGIPPLVALLSHDIPEVHRNACGALRNLSYGRQNDENKRAIHAGGGVPALVRLLRRTPENEVKELGTGVLWNLSSCEQLKQPIIDDALVVLVNYVVIPHSGWTRGGGVAPAASAAAAVTTDVFWSTVFRNATGVLRNVSSAGEYARRRLRECEGLVDALLLVVRSAIGKANIDNKCVENCVCVLRNLSYRCQEVDDPDYDQRQWTSVPQQNRAVASGGVQQHAAGCFGGRKQRDEAHAAATAGGGAVNGGVGGGMHLLWQSDIVQPYLKLLSDCSNPETLEAAAGALQNLAACYWQPSVDIRATVRKEKGLPILVELLRMEADRVVCAVATALRNLAIDQRNKELIGKYAMRDLVQKLPGPGDSIADSHDATAVSVAACSDDTIAAVLATLNEVVRKSAEFCRSLFELDGVRRLLALTRQRGRYSQRVVKFAGQLLFSMWMHQELRDSYKKAGYREADFVSKCVVAGRGGAVPGSSAGGSVNSTLNRPMASQGGTRFEDRTMPRGGYSTADYAHLNQQQQHLMSHQLPQHRQQYQQQHVFEPGLYQQQGSEPVYAQVNRDRKRQQQQQQQHGMSESVPAAHVWSLRDNTTTSPPSSTAAAGDSWV